MAAGWYAAASAPANMGVGVEIANGDFSPPASASCARSACASSSSACSAAVARASSAISSAARPGPGADLAGP
eukprot:2107293-Prymnesium_polylepis.1